MIAQEAENTAPDFNRQKQIWQSRRYRKARRYRCIAGGRDDAQ
jgi:hypothetical protein